MEVRTTLAYDEIARMVDTISSLGYHREDIPQLLERFLSSQQSAPLSEQKAGEFPGKF